MVSPALVLQFTIFVPLLAATGLILFRRQPNLREGVTLVAGAILFALVLYLYSNYQRNIIASVHWLEIVPGLALSFRVEALSLMFALVASLLWPVTTLYAIGYMRAHEEHNQTRFYLCFALAIAATMAICFSANLFTLFIFYELLTLSTYPLVTHSGTEGAKQGGRTYLGILLSTSIVFFLFAIILTWVYAGTLEFVPGGLFDETVPQSVLSALLVLFFFGVGKAALMPFHRWLPAAMVAPTPVSALLHAVAVVKAGVFTLLKISLFVFGLDLLTQIQATQWMLYVAGTSVLLASIVAIRQDNLKKRLAYSTIGQLGYITVGALLATQLGIIGGSMHIVAHAFGKITLFFCAGAILVAAHKTKVSELRGIGAQMPITMGAFFIASLSIIGVPPGGGTWSKWYLMLGSLESGQWFIVITLAISTLLNIAYLLPIPVLAFFPARGSRVVISSQHIKEAPLPALLALCLTATLSILLFLYPQPFYQLSHAILVAPGAPYALAGN